MKRMLVGIDGSTAAAAALAWTAAVARRLDAEVIAAYVYAAEPTDNASWEEAHERSLRRVEEWCSFARSLGVIVDPVVLDGEVGPALLAAAAERDAELVVVSRRGSGGVGGLLMGSAADYVAHHARCPVAVLPPLVEPAPPAHLLIGFDGSDEATAAGRWSAPLAAKLGARATCAYVMVPPVLGREPTSEQREEAEHALAEWTQPLRDAEVPVEPRILADPHPADALNELARAQQADLVVVGTRRVGGLRWIRLGGVTMQLLHHSDRPVIIVPRSADS